MQVRMIPISSLCTQFPILIIRRNEWKYRNRSLSLFFLHYLLLIRSWKNFPDWFISLTVCKPSLHSRTLYSFTTSSWKWIGLQRRMKLHWSAVMTLHFLVSLCFWRRIMRDVTFFTLFDFFFFISRCEQQTEQVRLCPSPRSIGHSIIREKRKVRRFISNMPDETYFAERGSLGQLHFNFI